MKGTTVTNYPDVGVEWTYDHGAQAGYLRLNDGKVARTEVFSGAVNVDFTSDGHILGVEMIGLGEQPHWLTLARVLRWMVDAQNGRSTDG